MLCKRVCVYVSLCVHTTRTHALWHTRTLSLIHTHTHTHTQELTEVRNAGHRLWKSWRLVAKFRVFYLFNFCLFFFRADFGNLGISSQSMCVHTQSVHEPINISLPTGGPCIHTLYLHTAAFICQHNMFTYFSSYHNFLSLGLWGLRTWEARADIWARRKATWLLCTFRFPE